MIPKKLWNDCNTIVIPVKFNPEKHYKFFSRKKKIVCPTPKNVRFDDSEAPFGNRKFFFSIFNVLIQFFGVKFTGKSYVGIIHGHGQNPSELCLNWIETKDSPAWPPKSCDHGNVYNSKSISSIKELDFFFDNISRVILIARKLINSLKKPFSFYLHSNYSLTTLITFVCPESSSVKLRDAMGERVGHDSLLTQIANACIYTIHTHLYIYIIYKKSAFECDAPANFLE